MIRDDLLVDHLPFSIEKHERSSKMVGCFERDRQTLCQQHIPQASVEVSQEPSCVFRANCARHHHLTTDHSSRSGPVMRRLRPLVLCSVVSRQTVRRSVVRFGGKEEQPYVMQCGCALVLTTIVFVGGGIVPGCSGTSGESGVVGPRGRMDAPRSASGVTSPFITVEVENRAGQALIEMKVTLKAVALLYTASVLRIETQREARPQPQRIQGHTRRRGDEPQLRDPERDHRDRQRCQRQELRSDGAVEAVSATGMDERPDFNARRPEHSVSRNKTYFTFSQARLAEHEIEALAARKFRRYFVVTYCHPTQELAQAGFAGPSAPTVEAGRSPSPRSGRAVARP